jgi:quinol monooxygenase YgiN
MSMDRIFRGRGSLNLNRPLLVSPAAAVALSGVLCLFMILLFKEKVLPHVELSTSAFVTSPFSLLVTLKFSALEHKEQFLLDIAPVAAYCKRHEPDTLAYEILLSDKDPLQVLVLERYRDKENAYLQIHRSSNPFLAFRAKLNTMQEAGSVTVSGESYLDTGVGFADRTAV